MKFYAEFNSGDIEEISDEYAELNRDRTVRATYPLSPRFLGDTFLESRKGYTYASSSFIYVVELKYHHQYIQFSYINQIWGE